MTDLESFIMFNLIKDIIKMKNILFLNHILMFHTGFKKVPPPPSKKNKKQIAFSNFDYVIKNVVP